MNLHQIAGPIVGSVNPPQKVGVQISVGTATAADGVSLAPAYATPGAITASIGATFTGAVPDPTQPTQLSVAGLLGSLWPGDAISGTDGVNVLPPGTTISAQISGQPGGTGLYQISVPAVLNSCEVTAASTVLNVTATVAGVLQPGQQLYDQGGVLLPGTTITGRLNGAGQVGTYSVGKPQTVASETMTTGFILTAQIQPLSFRDLAQLDGVNLSGEHKALYVNGRLDGVVRPRLKGGDVVTTRDGAVWLVVQILESWSATANWTKAVIMLQSDVVVAAPSAATVQSDPQPATP
jgi:hypothetical protein